MKTRTWIYGTRKQVRVLRASTTRRNGQPVPLLVVVETTPAKEGHILVDGGGEHAKPGDLSTIIFTRGGQTGGFWKYEQPTPTPSP